MSYQSYYPNGWQSGESGKTPITPEALQHMENGIKNAAPAGYGLGRLVNYECSNDAEVDARLVSLIASMGDHEFRRVVLSLTNILESLRSGGHWYADIYKLSTNYAIVTAKSYYLSGCTIQRIWYEGELNPWEWFNPPMITGVEYRTTIRYNGSVVYVKKVNFGALPNNAEKGVYAVPTNARAIGIGGNARGQYDIPIPGYYAIESLGVTPGTGSLWLSTTKDMSAYSADITVWYIKE